MATELLRGCFAVNCFRELQGEEDNDDDEEDDGMAKLDKNNREYFQIEKFMDRTKEKQIHKGGGRR